MASTRWTCPNCNRVFGKTNQRHGTCEPAVTLTEYFAHAKPFEQPVFEAVHAGIGHLDGLIVDPIGIGILLKNGPMFAELRPKTKWTAVGFSLGRRLESSRLSRKTISLGNKFFHVINVDDPSMIDDELISWLLDAYHLAGGTQPPNRGGVSSEARNSVGERAVRRASVGDGMVPDDVDDDLV